jgi:hypothetical protein
VWLQHLNYTYTIIKSIHGRVLKGDVFIKVRQSYRPIRAVNKRNSSLFARATALWRNYIMLKLHSLHSFASYSLKINFNIILSSDLLNLIKFGEDCKSRSPLFCNLFHLFISSLLSQNIFLGTLFSNAFNLCSFLFLNSHSGWWSPYWVHSARRPLIGLLYLPRVIVMLENLVEWRLAGETEVLGENLPQRHFVYNKSHLIRPGLEPGPPRWEASD